MKHKQQNISRFFAPKSPVASSSSQPQSQSQSFKASPAPLPTSSPTVQWPPSRASASLRSGFSNLPTKKRSVSEEHRISADTPSQKRRPLSDRIAGAPSREVETVDLERLEDCSGAISSGEERVEGKDYGFEVNAGSARRRKGSIEPKKQGGETLGLTYKRRRRTLSNSEQPSTRVFEQTERDGVEEVFEQPSTVTDDGFSVDGWDTKHEFSEDAIRRELGSGRAPDSVAERKSKSELEIPASDPARHKKFVEKLLARTDDERVLPEPKLGKANAKEKYTPLEQQVVELKAKYTDVLLMVEVGYRYRFFGEDAETAARTLGIFAYNDHNFLTASIPSYRLHVHVRRLVEAGYKVGVVRQTETAAIKAHGGNKVGPFSRCLSALYTRATLEAAEDLGGGETPAERGRLSSYLMCVAEQIELPKSSSKKTNASPIRKQGEQLVQNAGEGDAEAMRRGTHDASIGVIAVETATGDVMYGQFKDTVMRSELEARLLTCSPAELLLVTPLSSATEKLLVDFAGPASNVRVERVPRDSFNNGGAISEVLDYYQSKDNDMLNPEQGVQSEENEVEEKVDASLEAVMAMPELVIQALALALRYLKPFGLEKVLRLGASFRPFADLSEMSLSSNTLQQLEILQNNADGTDKGSLLWLMDHTHTAFGARLFHHWLIHPLCDRALILARLDAVSEIAESMGSVGGIQPEGPFPSSSGGGGSVGAVSRGRMDAVARGQQGLLATVLLSLKKMPDIERGITRIFLRTATAAEFVAVIQALVTAVRQLQRLHSEDEYDSEMVDTLIKEEMRGTSSQLLKRLLAAASSSVVSEHAVRLLSSLNKDAAVAGDKHNLFTCAGGKFPVVAKCRAAVKVAEQRLESFLPQFRKLLRMSKLEYTTVSGTTHLIEVPVAQRVPKDWVKVNSTQKMHRYHSPEVLEALDSLTLAKEELTVECNKAWDTFLAEFSSCYVDFRAAVQALAALDCLYSLAIVSRNQGYTRPEFVENEPAQLMIEGGRHPVLESTLQDGFVPNDTLLHAEKERCQIITGPNMGGKSCYIRQVALIAIMAQVGSYVPAAYAKLHVFDGIYTRMGASDSIQRGSSTFLEELSETSTILQRATSHSLVIVDELGRGTSTHDGVAIAYATLDYFLKEIRCLTLFVTHYPKLAELRDKYPGEVGPYHVSYLAEQSLPIEKAEPKTTGEQASPVLEAPGGTAGEQVCDPPGGHSLADEAAQKITFLYKLVGGVASRSFGLHVARLAQVPEACVLRAAAMAANLEKEVSSRAHLVVKNSGKQEKVVDSLSEECIHGLRKADSVMCNGRSSDDWDSGELTSKSNACEGEGERGVEELHKKVPLELSEGFVRKTSAAKVSEVFCSVWSALKCCNSEEAISVLKKAQEQAISVL